MPAKARWLLRVPEIVSELSTLDVPVVDRAVCERLFGLRRRRAIDLIRSFGGYQVGRTFLVDRPKLIAQLEQIRDGADFKTEWRRKERLAERLDAIRRLQTAARIAIAVEPETLRRRLPDLPSGVSLAAGELHIQCRYFRQDLGDAKQPLRFSGHPESYPLCQPFFRQFSPAVSSSM